MDSSYFGTALARYRRARAIELGCDESAFDTHALTIVELRPSASTQTIMLVSTLGTGTVVSVDGGYLEWVREHAPGQHYRALFPNVLLQPVIEEAAQRGDRLTMRSPNLSFIAGGEPVAFPAPEGLRLEPLDNAGRAELLLSGTFDNALGKATDWADQHWRFGVALKDGAIVIAVAGAWHDGDGILEIGVDVERRYRGRGLSRVVVTAMAAFIHARGCVPSYYCSPTNVLSHRTALSCGFVPVASTAWVTRNRPPA